MGNMISAIFTWWFVESPKKLILISRKTLIYLYHYFSIGYLAKTLFAPWKRDVTEVINPTLQDRLNMFANYLISVVMGFMVRFFTIVAGFIMILGTAILAVAVFFIWYFLSLIVIYLIYLGMILI